MEKFLEGLTRYLHRQRLESLKVHQLSQEGEQQYGSYESDVIDRSGSSPNIESERSPSSSFSSSSSSELANNSVLSHPRQPMANKWPWSLSHLEERTEDADFKERQQQPPYAKRNSELINSLLGLPRFMKVVGWKIQKTGEKKKSIERYGDGIDTNIEFSILLYYLRNVYKNQEIKSYSYITYYYTTNIYDI